MVIQRARESRRTRSNAKNINMTIDIMTFNILCRYVISSSSYLRITHLINLRKLIDGLDQRTYENDPDKIKRIRFLIAGLEARIDYKLNDINLVMNHITSRIDFDIDFIDFNNYELNADEIIWVHNMVSESLQYFFVYDYSDKLLDLCTRIKSSDYQHRGVLIQEFEHIVDQLKNQFRTSKTDDSLTDMTFSLRPDKFEQSVTETHNLIRNPSRRLMTGMQGLNEMIGGGFESGRVYMLLGITGIGKSITILNLLYQLKLYNKHYKTKDPTKTPCIVLLTMENTVVETITRLFDLVVNNSQGMANYTIDEVLRKLREEGQLFLNSDSPIDIVIKYKANKSVDTSYLYTLCDDLEDDGYEVICLIQDHVKRIRSIYNSSDLRLELGDIVNEFKVFAADRDIPVITNSHLNRDAARVIEEEGARTVKTDVTMKLGKQNAGESLLMMDNIDCAIIINKDFDEEGNMHMVFKIIKMRDKTEREYIAQPFKQGSTIRMAQDVDALAPMFKEHLHMNQGINRNGNIRTSSSNVMNNINNIVYQNKNLNSTFGNSNIYTFSEEDDEKQDNIEIVRPTIIKPIRFVPIIKEEEKPKKSDLTEIKSKGKAS